jgi:hypothetical protein
MFLSLLCILEFDDGKNDRIYYVYCEDVFTKKKYIINIYPSGLCKLIDYLEFMDEKNYVYVNMMQIAEQKKYDYSSGMRSKESTNVFKINYLLPKNIERPPVFVMDYVSPMWDLHLDFSYYSLGGDDFTITYYDEKECEHIYRNVYLDSDKFIDVENDEDIKKLSAIFNVKARARINAEILQTHLILQRGADFSFMFGIVYNYVAIRSPVIYD